MTFILHPDLVRDCHRMGRFDLCHVLRMDDATYPWFVLVPEVPDISDTIDLSDADHARMWAESKTFSAAIMAAYRGDKLNVAALGNMTPQLHLHHVMRFASDPAWPGPIWGKVPMAAMGDARIAEDRARLEGQNMPGYRPAG